MKDTIITSHKHKNKDLSRLQYFSHGMQVIIHTRYTGGTSSKKDARSTLDLVLLPIMSASILKADIFIKCEISSQLALLEGTVHN